MRATTALLLGACLTTVALSGCLTPDRAPGPVPFETVAKGQGSEITDPRTLTIRDPGAWGDLWLEHHPGEQDGSIAIPAINFSQRMVIAVFQGQQPNICHEVEITGLNVTEAGRLVVEGTSYVAPADAVCGEALVQPFHIVSAPAVDAPVEFHLEERAYMPDDGGDPSDDPDEPTSTNVTFETIAQGGDSGLEARQERVIRDNATWQELWAHHTDRHTDPPPVPEVDFPGQMVLAIFKGASPDGCHRAQIREVTEADNGSYVVDGVYAKVEAGACTLAVTYPYHMITVPADEAPVVFRIEDRTDSQGGQTDGKDGNVTYETLDRGSQSGIEDRREIVVEDAATWRSLWENHTEGQQPAPDRPAVDFSSEIVVAIFKGQSPDGCHGAEITNVTSATASDGSTEVSVEASYYKVTGGACSQQITYPFHIVKVRAQPDEVTFSVHDGERQA